MRGEQYYLDETFLEFLDSPERKKMVQLDDMLSIIWPLFERSKNILDFGAGIGGFSLPISQKLEEGQTVYACEIQERMIDFILKKKIEEKIRVDSLTPFFMDKTDRPIFPGWLPEFDLIWAQECLSTFVNPTLALDSFRDIMHPEAYVVIVDYERIECPIGPELNQKVSKERMQFFIEEAYFQIRREFQVGDFHYAFLCNLAPNADEADRPNFPSYSRLLEE